MRWNQFNLCLGKLMQTLSTKTCKVLSDRPHPTLPWTGCEVTGLNSITIKLLRFIFTIENCDHLLSSPTDYCIAPVAEKILMDINNSKAILYLWMNINKNLAILHQKIKVSLSLKDKSVELKHITVFITLSAATASVSGFCTELWPHHLVCTKGKN